MKRIEAIIRPHKMDEVLKALQQAGASGVTIFDTVGFGRQLGHSEVFKGGEDDISLVPKRMLVTYVTDDNADRIIKTIADTARTEQIGDGKIAISNLENVVRIRTGEEGNIAL